MKIIIGINNLTSVDQLAYGNHLQFFYRLGRSAKPDDIHVVCNPRRMSIDRMRNFCAKVALEGEFDWLLFLDDDVIVPPPFKFLERMISYNKDILAGITIIRGYPFHPMVFKEGPDYPESFYDDYKDHKDEEGLVECDAVGFSLCLIKVDLLRKMRPPYFITGPNHTEDIYFCKRAKEQVPGTKIYADPSIETGHILGSEIVEPNSIKFWKQLEEDRNPELHAEAIMTREGDRTKRSIELLGIKV